MLAVVLEPNRRCDCPPTPWGGHVICALSIRGDVPVVLVALGRLSAHEMRQHADPKWMPVARTTGESTETDEHLT
jgi:hypothetical protein